ncbi:MAG TPA: hypothetical protein VM492_10180 [Sumerlaeia bacterium]|nr:hypothetical protein [Sumerlaeia bacterium]
MKEAPQTRTIANQPSFVLETANVEAAVTRKCGMLAPVVFCRDSAPVTPYAIAPWHDEEVPAGAPAVVEALRGDFMCSAFGGNEEPFKGRRLPVHGETASEEWDVVEQERTDRGVALRLAMNLALQGGRCVKHTALVKGHNVVYQRDDFSAVDGPINPGHHATLQFPDRPGAGRLSFSSFAYAHTFIEPCEDPAQGGYSWLKPDQRVEDLAAVPCIDGSVADVTRYPARRGFEDIVILCADPSLRIAWSTVTFPEEGWLWFSLRDPGRLPSTLLWISNGGRHYPPWNGRHVNVMGIEDMTGFFHVGLAASARDNMLSGRGFKTCHRLSKDETLEIPYVQGVARIPGDFDRVAAVEVEDAESVRFVSDSGVSVSIPCHADFCGTGKLGDLIP